MKGWKLKMTENALITKPQLTPDVWKLITDIAPAMAQSRLFGVTEQQAVPILLKGYELGLGFTASFEFIHLIDGKPGLSPRGMLALIQQSPNFESMEIQDITNAEGKPYSCRVTMKRKNGNAYTVEFTMDDAIRAELVKKGSGWEKYPANMLRWRAIGFCADVVFPDVIGGMKRTDELGAEITSKGDTLVSSLVIENGTQSPQMPLQSVTEAIKDYDVTLPRLMEIATQDEILEANNGAFPLPNQVNEVVRKLVMAGHEAMLNEIQSNS
jgi:hypothetical protein